MRRVSSFSSGRSRSIPPMPRHRPARLDLCRSRPSRRGRSERDARQGADAGRARDRSGHERSMGSPCGGLRPHGGSPLPAGGRPAQRSHRPQPELCDRPYADERDLRLWRHARARACAMSRSRCGSVLATPFQPANLSNIGTCHFMAGRYAEAVEFQRRAVQLRPHFGTAWRSLAAAAGMAGDIAQAASALRRRCGCSPV